MAQPKDPNRIHSRHETSSQDVPGFTWGRGFNIQWAFGENPQEGATLIAILNALKDRLSVCGLMPKDFTPPAGTTRDNRYAKAIEHLDAVIELLNKP